MKPYEEIAFNNGYLRWIREGDEYVCRMSEGYMREMKALHEAISLIPDQQRPWVGLTEEQFVEAARLAEAGNYLVAFQRIQQWLKEKNS